MKRVALALWFTALLSWNDNSNDESGFIIEHKPRNGGWKELARVGRDVTTFRVTIEDGKGRHCFRIITFILPARLAGPSNQRCIIVDSPT